jgi:gag-polyprotein putative aspartyl protease
VPCISGSFNPIDGIYYQVIILPVGKAGFDGPELINQQFHYFKALLDTGAQITCISQRVSERLELVPRGRGTIVSASETTETNIYLFRVGFVMSGVPSTVPGTFSGNLEVFGNFEGLEIHAENDDDVDVLLGMDVLARGNFSLGFDGRWMLCW